MTRAPFKLGFLSASLAAAFMAPGIAIAQDAVNAETGESIERIVTLGSRVNGRTATDVNGNLILTHLAVK
ncbi:hypothetical protein [uncultured Idiomarina sp.]|uniref:hypothetical protein n=1 Tax=uncultured Idiomarina sp. TaxID=352961 RepID=UPI00259614CF|nr:hypothetical protein [uncultured Idiomarina sp.]